MGHTDDSCREMVRVGLGGQTRASEEKGNGLRALVQRSMRKEWLTW
jgi:hypothetical protein